MPTIANAEFLNGPTTQRCQSASGKNSAALSARPRQASCEMRHPVFPGCAKETDVIRNLMKSAKASQISARRVEHKDVQFFQSACMESYARPA